MSNSKKVSSNKKYQDFLLSFFEDDYYQEREVNGFWLVKKYDGSKDIWDVYLYTAESFKAYKNPQTLFNEIEDQDSFLKSI